jgi:mannitol-1-phosphate 5-dehydrogenase
VHNLGHAAVAYLGHRADPSLTCIWQAVVDPAIRIGAEAAMLEAAQALLRAYPSAFTRAELDVHIADLLHRFANRALGDTIFRVGRDLRRKLGREDRLIGAMRLCQAQQLPYTAIAEVTAAALAFRAENADGGGVPEDLALLEQFETADPFTILAQVTGLDSSLPEEQEILRAIIMAVGHTRASRSCT